MGGRALVLAAAAVAVALLAARPCAAVPPCGSGDPHFTGFDESDYLFNGEAAQWFNLISDASFQLNAYFSAYGDNAIYMTAFGVQAGRTRVSYTLNDTLRIDGVAATSSFANGDVSVERNAKSHVVVKSRVFQLELFARTDKRGSHLNVRAAVVSRPVNPHGVLGQTAAFLAKGEPAIVPARVGKNHQGKGVVEGHYVDYIVHDGQFGSDFKFNRFDASAAGEAVTSEGVDRRRAVAKYAEGGVSHSAKRGC